jgi:SAM-dependent methyltransferase
MSNASVLDRYRRERLAGGYSRDNGSVAFFSRVNALLEPHMTVIDYGAGRGHAFQSDRTPYFTKLAKLQGKVAKVIGIDVDDAILTHPHLDERHVIGSGAPLPVGEEQVDLIVSDWVFEHVEKPGPMTAEFHRVLKPGGWVCARTPNRWGYVGLGSRLTPNAMHNKVLRTVRPESSETDTFPVTYRINSMRDLDRFFPRDKWKNYSYACNETPAYFAGSGLVFKLIEFYQAVAPEALKTYLTVLVQKRGG